MKKLMIAAAVALATVASQAASVTWTSANAYVDGWNNDTGKYTPTYYPGTALNGLMVYVFDANATDMSQAYIYDQVINQGKSLSQLTSVDNAAVGSDGLFASPNVICDTENWTGKTRTSGTKSYIDLIAAATWKDEAGNEYLYLSSTMSAQVQSSKDTALTDGNTANTRKFYDGATAYSSGGWYAVSVPEPTSGLLLLLGVAGLALRRRRA